MSDSESGKKRVAVLLGLLAMSLVALGLTVSWRVGWWEFEVEQPRSALLASSHKEALRQLVTQHPDPRISADLVAEWNAGTIWVLPADLLDGQVAVFQELDTREAYARYRRRPETGVQTVLLVSTQEIDAAQSDPLARQGLEADLLKTYESFVLRDSAR